MSRGSASTGATWGRRDAAPIAGGPGSHSLNGKPSGGDGGAAARTFILSWDEPARDRLRTRCHATDVIDVVGFARDLRSALHFLREEPVDVVLAELDAARGSPAGVVSILRSVLPDVRIVVWGNDVTHFEDAFDAGADAWISRSATPGTLAAAVTGRHIADSSQ